MKVDYVRVYQRDDQVGQEPDLLQLTVNTRCLNTIVNEVQLTGPWANNWHPDSAEGATDNGDGTWTVTQSRPLNDIEYLWIVNGEYENLIQRNAGWWRLCPSYRLLELCQPNLDSRKWRPNCILWAM